MGTVARDVAVAVFYLWTFLETELLPPRQTRIAPQSYRRQLVELPHRCDWDAWRCTSHSGWVPSRRSPSGWKSKTAPAPGSRLRPPSRHSSGEASNRGGAAWLRKQTPLSGSFTSWFQLFSVRQCLRAWINMNKRRWKILSDAGGPLVLRHIDHSCNNYGAL